MKFRAIYGVDFSGARLAGRNTWVARIERKRRDEGCGSPWRLAELARLEDLCGTAERAAALGHLVGLIGESEGALWSLDFPFGLPLEVVGERWSGQFEFPASMLKPEPNQVDPALWVYDIGVNSDCSVDAAISDNVRDLVELFRSLPDAKGSFATKFVNHELLDLDPQRKMRIRFSVMPEALGRLLDVRTSPMRERIAAMAPFHDAGWEVQFNFSPVVITEDWLERYDELFREIDDTIPERVKRHLACEVIFLTHNERLHEVNLGWHPTAEDYLWTPENQQAKISQGGGHNIRYRTGYKGRLVQEFRRAASLVGTDASPCTPPSPPTAAELAWAQRPPYVTEGAWSRRISRTGGSSPR